MRRRLLTLLFLLFGGAAAAAEPPRFSFPVACMPGQDCWIFQYFDHDSGPGWRDYACGRRSYDGHDGTDIALRDIAAISQDFAVLAAAPGKVLRVRDGMPDALYDSENPDAVKDRDCGNGALIDHGEGWQTQYCHLRNGSVRVRPGAPIAAGAVIGTVGLSGRTAFPHVEFRIFHDGKSVDPFVGEGAPAGCGLGNAHLWAKQDAGKIAYSPVDILAVGFAPGAPEPADAHAGRLDHSALPADAPALVAWATIAGGRQGDRLSIRLLAPDGRVLAESDRRLERDRIRYFGYAGRKRRDAAWPPGQYRADIRLERDGDRPVRREAVRTLTVH